MSSFKYYCTLCGAPARKPGLVGRKTREESADGTLGTWHCSKPCTKAKIKVRREKVS